MILLLINIGLWLICGLLLLPLAMTLAGAFGFNQMKGERALRS